MTPFGIRNSAAQQAFSAWRDRALSSVTVRLARRRVRPHHVTALSVLLLLAGVVLPARDWWPLVILLLTLYCLLDGLDGALARHSGTPHEGGAILDIAADHAGIPLVAAAAVYHLSANPVAAVLFSNAYLAALALGLYAGGRRIVLWRLLRVKYVFYGVYGLSAAMNADMVTALAAVSALYYCIYILQAVMRIHLHFDQAGKTARQGKDGS